MRVIILDEDPRQDFRVFICFETGKKQMDAPFFLKQEYFEGVTWENLFFPWRSPLSTYDPYMSVNLGKKRYFGLRGGCRKRSNAWGNVTKMFGMNPLMLL